MVMDDGPYAINAEKIEKKKKYFRYFSENTEVFLVRCQYIYLLAIYCGEAVGGDC